MSLHQLRYTGTRPVTFVTGPGHVEPGDEFTVPDEALDGFTRRADVEHAAECPGCPDGPPAEPAAEPRRPRRGTPA